MRLYPWLSAKLETQLVLMNIDVGFAQCYWSILISTLDYENALSADQRPKHLNPMHLIPKP